MEQSKVKPVGIKPHKVNPNIGRLMLLDSGVG